MKICLLLLIALLACSESAPVSPTGQIFLGRFVLTKAVGHQPMDLGGDRLEDPLIIRHVPHTYYYPDGAGRLILRKDTFYMEAPMSLQPIHIKGTRQPMVEGFSQTWRYDELNTGRTSIGTLFNYTWIGDSLKIGPFTARLGTGITWELYWKRVPGW